MENELELPIFEIINSLLKRAWIIILATIIGFSGALIYTLYLTTDTYVSSAQLYVNANQNNANVGGNASDLAFAKMLVDSYMIILTNDVFLAQVAEESGLPYSSGQIRGMLSMAAMNETEIFQVAVASGNPQDSYVLVKTITELAREEIIRVKELDSVKIVSPATLPTSPVPKRTAFTLIIGAALGFILAAAVIILNDILDTRVKSEEDLVAKHSLLVLGCIPKYEEG